ncbi:MAG: hypothetical protein M3R46_11060 [Actinomycetota bacterium]|nr:hypothetical protein [Actinomycetota bacterium]
MIYHFSRAIYREIARDIRAGCGHDARTAHAQVLRACEQTVERLANDRHYFAKPARTLFSDVRMHFPMSAQARVWQIISAHVSAADEELSRQPPQNLDPHGNPLVCRATTRRGTPCQRAPLPHNGYCPSHQHLAETEHTTVLAA